MTYITFRLFAENVLQCEVSLSRQAAVLQKKGKKKRGKEKSDEIIDEKSKQDKKIIEGTCALLNSGGGVVRMAISDLQALQGGNFLCELDMFWKGLEPKLTSLVMPSTYGHVFDRSIGTKEILLFVNAPGHMCTIDYNLYVLGKLEFVKLRLNKLSIFLERRTIVIESQMLMFLLTSFPTYHKNF